MAAPRPAIQAAIAVSLLIAVPFIGSSEGKRNDPYIDMAGIPTVCYGETHVTMRHYTNAECLEMLHKSVEVYTTEVLRVTPALGEKPYVLAAVTSLTYNSGVDRYSSSSMAKLFAARQWKAGCEQFKKWVYVKGKVVKGLVNRRNKEYAICISHL